MTLKHIVVGILVSSGFIVPEMNAMSYYQSVQTGSGYLADKIKGVDNCPVIGKLTNLLPFTALVTCLRECPGQTAAVVAGMLAYMLYTNDKIGSVVRKYNPFPHKKTKAKNRQQFDDSLFIFEDDNDSEDELIEEFVDANLEEEIIDEEILEEEMFNEELVDECYEIASATALVEQPRIMKFL